jgi:hypothetical protein
MRALEGTRLRRDRELSDVSSATAVFTRQTGLLRRLGDLAI